MTRAISAIASSGRSKWSIAPLQITASKSPSAKGSASASARTQRGASPARFALWSRAQPVMRGGGLGADDARAALGERDRVLAEAARHVEDAAGPAPAVARASVSSVMRAKR